MAYKGLSSCLSVIPNSPHRLRPLIHLIPFIFRSHFRLKISFSRPQVHAMHDSRRHRLHRSHERLRSSVYEFVRTHLFSCGPSSSFHSASTSSAPWHLLFFDVTVIAAISAGENVDAVIRFCVRRHHLHRHHRHQRMREGVTRRRLCDNAFPPLRGSLGHAEQKSDIAYHITS